MLELIPRATHVPNVLDTLLVTYIRNNDIYGIGVGISIAFNIFCNFPFLGVGLIPGPIPNVLHILPVT
jgi:hypothetical protein